MKTIYFNQWFSSITDVIADIKAKHGDSVKIIGSSKNPDHAYKGVVDEFIVEDWEDSSDTVESDNNYLKWLIETLKSNKVDIFFAKKHSSIISKNIDKLEEIGVYTILENHETLGRFDKKSDVYKELLTVKELKHYIPVFYNGTSLNNITDLINSSVKGSPWCFKLDTDEGGYSYRAIEQDELDLSSLNHFRVNSISASEAVSLVSKLSKSELDKLLFMEILDSPEISVDCYNSKQGFIAICREKKSGTRVQKIYRNDEISKICENIGKHYDLKYTFNVQFRVHHKSDKSNIENLRLLEINPRMSGGTYYATLLGINLANICLNDIIGESNASSMELYNKLTENSVTHVEKAVLL